MSKATVVYQGGQASYSFPFDYLTRSFVKVDYIHVDGTSQPLNYGVDYKVVDKMIMCTLVSDATDRVKIYRQTPTTQLVTFVDSSILRSKDLNALDIQLLHISEESMDRVDDAGLSKDESDEKWNAKQSVIKNVADGVSQYDAVNRGQLDTIAGGASVAVASAAAARQSELNASNLVLSTKSSLVESTGYGIVSGCAPSINGLIVTVASGVVHLPDGTRKELSASTITLDTADATNPRIDLVYIDSTGTVAKIAGMAVANPSAPALPANGVSVAQVNVATNATTGTVTDTRGVLPRWQNTGVVNVKDFGAKGDGVTDDVSAIKSAIYKATNTSGILLFPQGIYILSSSISLENISIIGDKKYSIIKTNFSGNAFDIGDNVKIVGISIYLQDSQATAFKARQGAQHITISNCKSTQGNFFQTTKLANNDYSDNDLAKDIKIYSNDISNAGDCAIYLQHCMNCEARNNYIYNSAHGIAWWGNEGNPSKYSKNNVTDSHYAKNIIIANNIIYNVVGGGIWGAMGDEIIIDGNIVKNCGDVGVDFEASINSTAINNIVTNCANGCLTAFFKVSNVLFTNNIVSQDGSYGVNVTRLETRNGNTSISFVNNEFFGKNILARTYSGAIDKTIFEGNKFTDVLVEFDGAKLTNGAGCVIFKSNDVSLSSALFPASVTWSYGAKGLYITRCNDEMSIVENNKIYADAQVTGTGIEIAQDVPPNGHKNRIAVKNNKIINFTKAIDAATRDRGDNVIYIIDNMYDGTIDTVNAQPNKIISAQNILLDDISGMSKSLGLLPGSTYSIVESGPLSARIDNGNKILIVVPLPLPIYATTVAQTGFRGNIALTIDGENSIRYLDTEISSVSILITNIGLVVTYDLSSAIGSGNHNCSVSISALSVTFS